MRSIIAVACLLAAPALSAPVIEAAQEAEAQEGKWPEWDGGKRQDWEGGKHPEWEGHHTSPHSPFGPQTDKKDKKSPSAFFPSEGRPNKGSGFGGFSWGRPWGSSNSDSSESPGGFGGKGGFGNFFGGSHPKPGYPSFSPKPAAPESDEEDESVPEPASGAAENSQFSAPWMAGARPTPTKGGRATEMANPFAGDSSRQPKYPGQSNGYPKPEKPDRPSYSAAPKSSPQGSGDVVRSGMWQPKVASLFQIVLSGTVDTSAGISPNHVDIFDIDLFNTPASTIRALKKQNKKVICYFSAGTSEDWREDFKQFKQSETGQKIAKDDSGKTYWEGEHWINIKNPNPNSNDIPNVWRIMRNRIKMAAEKGCDAIDPDNVGQYFRIVRSPLTRH
jgi:hypothetical protein